MRAFICVDDDLGRLFGMDKKKLILLVGCGAAAAIARAVTERFAQI